MKRTIVDTNFLTSVELKEYLSDPSSIAVIPDFAVMETLKIGDAKRISDQLAILAERPSQVKILKSTHAVSGLRAKRRSRGLQRRLVDKGQTAAFKSFCDNIEGAKNGDKALERQLAEKCELATLDLDKIAKGQETFAANLAEHAKNYTEAELKILRKGEKITPELYLKIIDQVFNLAYWLFAAHPYFERQPDFRTLPNAFLFRFAVAGYVIALRCLKEGGANGASKENIRNQMVDAMFATYATYFDGILTKDKGCEEIYATTVDVLKALQEGFKELKNGDGRRRKSWPRTGASSAFGAKRTAGRFCDGRASLIVGTHIHTPSADDRILPCGTAFMTGRRHDRRIQFDRRHGEGGAASVHDRHCSRPVRTGFRRSHDVRRRC
jgi:hypothetical protein